MGVLLWMWQYDLNYWEKIAVKEARQKVGETNDAESDACLRGIETNSAAFCLSRLNHLFLTNWLISSLHVRLFACFSLRRWSPTHFVHSCPLLHPSNMGLKSKKLYEDQSYKKSLQQAIDCTVPFNDDIFRAADSSIFKERSFLCSVEATGKIVWKRPLEIDKDAHLVYREKVSDSHSIWI